MKIAVIGIGSNSLRMLLANVKGNQFERIKRYRAALRVFAALDDCKNISQEMIINACSAINSFKTEATADGAERFYLFATSAVRDAKNQTLFAKTLFEETGLALEICSGSKEAELSFLGAAEPLGFSGLIDIGGGSTEIAVGKNGQLLQTDSMQMGAVRLWEKYPLHSAKDINPITEKIESEMHSIKNCSIPYSEIQWTGVGGTLTTAAALLQNIPWNQKQLIHGYHLEYDALKWATMQLADLPLSERMQLESLQPQRADIIVHGLCILLACFQAFDVSKLRVSEYGNLEGYVHYLLQNNLLIL